MSGDGDGEEAERLGVGVCPARSAECWMLATILTPEIRITGRITNNAKAQSGCFLYWSGMIFMGTS